MLPYHQLQAAYVVGSGLVALTVGVALRRRAPRLALRWRLPVAVAVVGALCLAAALAFPHFLDFRDARGFAVVSIAFYAGGLWLPLLALSELWRRRREGVDRAAGVLAAGAIGLSLWAMLVEPNRLQVRHEVVEIAAWPADADPVVLVHLSDLQSVGACARERRALALALAQEPDLIVVSGDYMAGPFWEPEPGIEAARAFLSGLRAPLGVYAVPGHAEPRPLRERIFAGLDASYLVDERRVLELGGGRRIELVGLDVHEPDLDVLDGPPAAGTARLVISHVPDVTRELDGRGVDLHLAGHTHGGQIALPGFGAPMTLSELPRSFARGLRPWGDHLVNVCAGIGMEGNHAPRIRLFCPPEICVLRLVGGGAGARTTPADPPVGSPDRSG